MQQVSLAPDDRRKECLAFLPKAVAKTTTQQKTSRYQAQAHALPGRGHLQSANKKASLAAYTKRTGFKFQTCASSSKKTTEQINK
eukprot:939058-Karenia_brevis.AAC.1